MVAFPHEHYSFRPLYRARLSTVSLGSQTGKTDKDDIKVEAEPACSPNQVEIARAAGLL